MHFLSAGIVANAALLKVISLRKVNVITACYVVKHEKPYTRNSFPRKVTFVIKALTPT